MQPASSDCSLHSWTLENPTTILGTHYPKLHEARSAALATYLELRRRLCNGYSDCNTTVGREHHLSLSDGP